LADLILVPVLLRLCFVLHLNRFFPETFGVGFLGPGPRGVTRNSIAIHQFLLAPFGWEGSPFFSLLSSSFPPPCCLAAMTPHLHIPITASPPGKLLFWRWDSFFVLTIPPLRSKSSAGCKRVLKFFPLVGIFTLCAIRLPPLTPADLRRFQPSTTVF